MKLRDFYIKQFIPMPYWDKVLFLRDISTYKFWFHVKLIFAISVSPVVLGQLVILSDMEPNLITFNPEYIPIADIIQGHFHKSWSASSRLCISVGG